MYDSLDSDRSARGAPRKQTQHNTEQRRRQSDPLYPIIHLSFAVYERPTRNCSKFIRTKINRDSVAEHGEQGETMCLVMPEKEKKQLESEWNDHKALLLNIL